MTLSTEAVLALAPDDASAKAAKGLLAPAKWPTLGFSDEAVWGECQGSGSKPYQTQVDLAGPVFRCSCPSRKFPCKHGLALMLLRAQSGASFTAAAPPPWVAEWLASRRDKAEKKEARAAEPVAAPDPAAAAKRDAQRWKRIEAGVQELARWLDDQTQRGLAALGSEQQQAWGAMAARMVDAQAPGLGQRLTQAAELIGAGEGWPARLLDRLGRLQLIVDAVPRRESLSPATLADLRIALGWPQDREGLLADGERIGDHWLVLGQCTDERDAKLVERHVWLQGRASGRRALLLDYSHGGRGFETGWVSGSERAAVLCFYPGHASQRALVAELLADAPASTQPATDAPRRMAPHGATDRRQSLATAAADGVGQGNARAPRRPMVAAPRRRAAGLADATGHAGSLAADGALGRRAAARLRRMGRRAVRAAHRLGFGRCSGQRAGLDLGWSARMSRRAAPKADTATRNAEVIE
jgi:hypothetical protein